MIIPSMKQVPTKFGASSRGNTEGASVILRDLWRKGYVGCLFNF